MKLEREELFQDLYARYSGLVTSICRSHARTNAGADDIIKTSFQKTFDKLHKSKELETHGNIVAWLCVVAERTTLDELRSYNRKDGKLVKVEFNDQFMSDIDDMIDRMIEDQDRREKVDKILSILKPKESYITYEHYGRGRKIADIAYELHMPYEQVKSILKNAKKKILNKFG